MSGLAGFRVGKKVGSGSFGDVFAAERVHGNQRVALKIVSKEKLQHQAARDRLVREVEIHSELRHKNLVALLDFFEDDEHVYLVMELCDRGELLRHVRTQGGLPEPEVRELFSQMVEGVAYLHLRAIIHRDIKLANILLTAAGEVKIADFGLAAVLEGADSERNTICGTPNYISPEIASQQAYSLATDVWSMGVVLYTMLTGTPPFQDDMVEGTLQNVRAAKFICPGKVSPEAADLLKLVLRKDPSKRPRLDAIRRHPFLQAPHAAQKGHGLNDSCFSLTAHLARLNTDGAQIPFGSTAMITARSSASTSTGTPFLEAAHALKRAESDEAAGRVVGERANSPYCGRDPREDELDADATAETWMPGKGGTLVEHTRSATEQSAAWQDAELQRQGIRSGGASGPEMQPGAEERGVGQGRIEGILSPNDDPTNPTSAVGGAGQRSNEAAAAADASGGNDRLACMAAQGADREGDSVTARRQKRSPGPARTLRKNKENQAQNPQQGSQRTGNPFAPSGLILKSPSEPLAALPESRHAPSAQRDPFSAAPRGVGGPPRAAGPTAHQPDPSFACGWVQSGGLWPECSQEPTPRPLSQVPQPSRPPSEIAVSYRNGGATSAAEESGSALVPYRAAEGRRYPSLTSPGAADWRGGGPPVARGRRETMTGSEPTTWLLDRPPAVRGRRGTLTGSEPTTWLYDRPRAVRGRLETVTGSEEPLAWASGTQQEAEHSSEDLCDEDRQGGSSNRVSGQAPACREAFAEEDDLELTFLPRSQKVGVEPLTRLPSTARLTPQTHRTPYGALALLPDGSVCVEHPASASRAFIAGDSSWVHYERGDAPTLRFQWADVPAHVAPFCATAAAFVHMLADATPRVVYLGSKGRAELLESDALVMTYYATSSMDGITSVRIELESEQATICTVDGVLHVLNLCQRPAARTQLEDGSGRQPVCIDVQHPQRWQAAILYALRSGEKCRQLEAKVLAEAGGNAVMYPLIARNRMSSCATSVCSIPR